MRHHNKNKKFGLEKDQRVALMRSLVRSLILKEKIKTTETKAKALRPVVERIITRGKVDTLHNRRIILSRLYNDTDVVDKVFNDISKRFKDRNGGYTRVTKIFNPTPNGRKEATIEFV